MRNFNEEFRYSRVLFETNFGKVPEGRQCRLGDRSYYKVLLEKSKVRGDLRHADSKVYELRWNQVGGPELLTTENHKGEGCNILFTDSHVEFVPAKRLGELRWKIEDIRISPNAR